MLMLMMDIWKVGMCMNELIVMMTV
ncbi:hypothetical protein LPC_2265 [Legionella pneumophila str. Corby]|nr:hypothetical protein LPC_2265 [Legionella pneumophila str. Corby]